MVLSPLEATGRVRGVLVTAHLVARTVLGPLLRLHISSIVTYATDLVLERVERNLVRNFVPTRGIPAAERGFHGTAVPLISERADRADGESRVVVDRWHHLEVVFDAGPDADMLLASLWVDGVLVGESALNDPSTLTPGGFVQQGMSLSLQTPDLEPGRAGDRVQIDDAYICGQYRLDP